MPREDGQIYITSKGRRFLRSMRINEEDTQPPDEYFPFLEDAGYGEDMDAKSYFIRGASHSETREEEPRMHTRRLVSLLKEIRDEGPFGHDYDNATGNHEAEDWLISNGYLRFVSL